MAKKDGVDGLKGLERSFKELGKVPQGIVTRAAKAGANIALKAAKANAPVDTGALKSGIIIKGERRVKPGKKVYDVMINPAMNDVFVKVSKDGKRSYYPASQEYGFMTADGGYIPGYRYLRKSITENVRQIENKVIEVAEKGVDKALKAR